MRVTSDLLAAGLKCPTKCWLRSHGEAGSGNEYADWVRTQNESYRRANAKRLLEGIPENERAISPPMAERSDAPFVSDPNGRDGPPVRPPWPTDMARTADAPHLKTAKWRLAVDLLAQTQELESCLHAVERVPSEGQGRAAQFIPIRFVFTNKLNKDDKLLMSFDALVLSEVLGREISIGKIMHGDDHATTKVKTAAQFKEVRKRTEKIAALLSNQSPPDLVLNRHCAECEFRDRCRQKAIEKDDLSLLAGMSEKERKKFNSKGIFTVTQLSYTFRPRRRPKRMRDKREKYHHALKALAIREKKIHIVGTPELKTEGTPVYLDVEGLPDRDFYYLIGVRIGNGESAVQHSLWADTVEDEGKIWREFLAILEIVEKPVLIHYGSYETTFFKRMNECHGSPPEESVAAKAIGSAYNLLFFVFAQIYFPIFSNGLKGVGDWLGFKWTGTTPSGIDSIRWRHEWEDTKKSQLKNSLVCYNTDDCRVLELVVRVAKEACKTSRAYDSSSDVLNVVNVDGLESRQTLWPKFSSPILEFEIVNKAAGWDYQRDRIYLRTGRQFKRVAKAETRCSKPAMRINEEITCQRPRVCPCCERKGIKPVYGATRILCDLRFSKFGLRRWTVMYHFRSCYCPDCHVCFGKPDEFWQGTKYGRNVAALLIFKTVDLCMQQRTIAQELNRLYQLGLHERQVHRFKAKAANFYGESRRMILAEMLKGAVIQADETRIVLKGNSAYVWVFASFREVVYFYSESREGDFAQKLLAGFKGVLVSDFYAAYDSIPCPQQRCLIHLMRDLNDALLEYPYDEEVKGIVTGFADLVQGIVQTIDRWGLKRHFLHKHQADVARFYRRITTCGCKGEPASKFKERFEKNRDKLFTFLNYDGVPWNNNNVEHAIKAFARLRRAIVGLSTPKGIEDYLILLSICQTCKYQGLDFLDFLRSGEKDIDKFAESRGRKRRQAPVHKVMES